MTSASSDDVLSRKGKAKDADGDEVMDDEETEDGNTTTQARRPPMRRRVKKAGGAGKAVGLRGGRLGDDMDADEERDIGEASDSDSDDERIVMKTRRSSTRVPIARKRDGSMEDDIELEMAPADAEDTQASALKFNRTALGRPPRLPQDPKKSPVVPTVSSVNAAVEEEEEPVEHVVPERVERVELPRFRDFEAAALGGSSQAVASLGMARHTQNPESSKMSIDSIVS